MQKDLPNIPNYMDFMEDYEDAKKSEYTEQKKNFLKVNLSIVKEGLEFTLRNPDTVRPDGRVELYVYKEFNVLLKVEERQ